MAISIDRSRVIKNDASALGADAARGGLEQTDDAEAEVPVAKRRDPIANAVGELADHGLQRLARLNIGTPDIAAAVAHEHLVPLGQVLPQLDAAVVNLDWLGSVQLVEDQAFAGAGEDHLANLDGRQPVDVEVG